MLPHSEDPDRADDREPIDRRAPSLIALAGLGLKLACSALAEFTEPDYGECTCKPDARPGDACKSCQMRSIVYDADGIFYTVRFFANSLFDSFVHGTFVRALGQWLDKESLDVDPELFASLTLSALKGKRRPRSAQPARLVIYQLPTSPSAN